MHLNPLVAGLFVLSSQQKSQLGCSQFHQIEHRSLERCRFKQEQVLRTSKHTELEGSRDEGSTKLRLNKVFKKTHSRRQADKLIEAGRVAVNGELVEKKGGYMVTPYKDEVTLDGEIVVGWEQMNGIMPLESSDSCHKERTRKNDLAEFEYVKYWKPCGVVCTTASENPANVIEALRSVGYNPPHRVFPVGRLDRDTSGIIILTSDGRLPNRGLKGSFKQPKTYHVRVDGVVSDVAIEKLRRGLMISTEISRDGCRRMQTAKTLPALVQKIDDDELEITVVEGRNRQIRKMMAAVGYGTLELHRVSFLGISLEYLQGPGDWAYLNEQEERIISRIVLGNR